MTPDTRDGGDRSRSIGVDAISLERYSSLEFDGAELLIYDESNDDAWIQADVWTPLADAA